MGLVAELEEDDDDDDVQTMIGLMFHIALHASVITVRYSHAAGKLSTVAHRCIIRPHRSSSIT